MKIKYAYLVSDGKSVSFTFVKPANVKIGKVNWRGKFTHKIGQAITIYTDDLVIGVLGVYDISKEDHLTNLLKDIREHSLSLAERQIEKGIHKIFGEKASTEVYGYMWAFDENRRRNHKWSTDARLLWNTSQVVKTVCFQGR